MRAFYNFFILLLGSFSGYFGSLESFGSFCSLFWLVYYDFFCWSSLLFLFCSDLSKWLLFSDDFMFINENKLFLNYSIILTWFVNRFWLMLVFRVYWLEMLFNLDNRLNWLMRLWFRRWLVNINVDIFFMSISIF